MRLAAFGLTSLLLGDSLHLWLGHTVTPVAGVAVRLVLAGLAGVFWVLGLL